MTTLAELRQIIADADAPVVALEALWDGDTSGWFLRLSAILERPCAWHPQYTRLHLVTLREGGDLRLFNGEVPPWPESRIATELGTALAQEHGVALYFPSPDIPDDQCADWWDREHAHRCPDCGVALMTSHRATCWFGACRACEERRKKPSGHWIYVDVRHDRASDVEWFEAQRERLQREVVAPGSGLIRVMNQVRRDELFVNVVTDRRDEATAGVLRWLRAHDLLARAEIRVGARVGEHERIWPVP